MKTDPTPKLAKIAHDLSAPISALEAVIGSGKLGEEQSLVVRTTIEKLGKIRSFALGRESAPPVEPHAGLEGSPDAVLIDDDPLVHMSWNFAAKEKGRTLRVYFSPDGFALDASTIDRSTPIYIDSDLGTGIPGEKAAKELFENGFKEIYLCTGHPPGRFETLPWIRGVLGKNPPW